MVMKTLIQYILCNRVSQKILSCISSICRKVARGIHQAQFFAYWGGTSTPEWFDHELDRYAQWGAPKGNCFWVERGVFSLLAIEPGAKILELCCGYGFNAKHFYAYKASSIVSCDFDPTAIAYAKTEHSNEKTEYIVADIRYNMPQGKFDNIVYFYASDQGLPFDPGWEFMVNK